MTFDRKRAAGGLAALVATLLLPARGALAAPETPPTPLPEAPPPDAPAEAPVLPWDTTPRPLLYAPDPTAPPPGHVLAMLSVGYAQTNRGAARPFAADVAHAGAVFSGGAEVGLLRWLSVHAEGLLAGGAGTDSPVAAGAMVGASGFPLGGRGPVDVSLSAGYLRELAGSNGVWFRGAVAGNLGRVRLTASALGEHVFEEGRDGVDVLLTAGASVKATGWLRFGAEYVVQDLEGAWDPEEADGGIRHFVAANAALVLGKRVQLALGPALGLSENSPRVLGRLTAAYAF